MIRYLLERQQEQQPMSERDRFTAMLRVHGLLSEPTPEELARAATCTVTLEEVQEALTRAGGTPLSDIVIAQRGPLV